MFEIKKIRGVGACKRRKGFRGKKKGERRRRRRRKEIIVKEM